MFFWLCESCCSTMTLRFDPHAGVKVVPLSEYGRRRLRDCGEGSAGAQRVTLLSRVGMFNRQSISAEYVVVIKVGY